MRLMSTTSNHDSRSMLERMQAGDLYQADDPAISELATGASERMAAYNASAPGDRGARRGLLEELVGEVGEGTELRPPVYVDYGTNIVVGARTFANFGLVALDVAPITIGDDVQIGPNVQLLTPTHPVEPTPRRDKWEAAKPITIGNNVWLGGGVIVLPGVTIGDNTVVGAGAVVTKDLPADVIAVGNPAKVIGTIGEGRV
jgi:maltose O-acetyltransferase